jgi:hypothetical protein
MLPNLRDPDRFSLQLIGFLEQDPVFSMAGWIGVGEQTICAAHRLRRDGSLSLLEEIEIGRSDRRDRVVAAENRAKAVPFALLKGRARGGERCLRRVETVAGACA